MSEMTTPPDDTPPTSVHQPPEPGDMKRHLFFGLALLLAFASMYAGVLQWGRVVQYALAVGALIVVLLAMTTGMARRGRRGPTG